MNDRRLFALLLVAYGWLFVWFEKLNNPNEMVRVYMARAIVEQGTYAIGRRGADLRDHGPVYSEWGYVNDKALVCDDPARKPPSCAGLLYAAKAPGPSLLAVPVLAVFRAVGGRLSSKAADVLVLRWVLGILPTVAFWVAMRRWLLLQDASAEGALAVTLCAALGSLSFTYGQMFAGHQLAALSLGTAFLACFWSERTTPAQAALAGFAAALSICCEYPSAPATALLGAGWLLSRRASPRAVAFAALAALVPLAALAHFHLQAFGSFWSTPYSHLENPGFVRDISPGFLGISGPTWQRVYGSLLSPDLGLFFWAPWTALALAAAPALIRRGGPAARTALAVGAYYLLFQVTHALWRSGWVVGPRYIAPIVPFAAAAVGLWARGPLRVAALAGTGIASIAATGLASTVCQGFPLEVYNPLVEVVAPLLAHGYAAPNLLQLAGVPGLWSALPVYAAFAAAIALLLGSARGARSVALALAAALVLAQWTATSGDSPSHRGAVRFLASVWNPSPPLGARPFRVDYPP
jgi:hypothetical protein